MDYSELTEVMIKVESVEPEYCDNVNISNPELTNFDIKVENDFKDNVRNVLGNTQNSPLRKSFDDTNKQDDFEQNSPFMSTACSETLETATQMVKHMKTLRAKRALFSNS